MIYFTPIILVLFIMILVLLFGNSIGNKKEENEQMIIELEERKIQVEIENKKQELHQIELKQHYELLKQELHDLEQTQQTTPEQFEKALWDLQIANKINGTQAQQLIKTYNALRIYPEPNIKE